MSPAVRPARAADLRVLRAVERAAGALFAEFGMPEIAADEPASLEELAAYADAGLAWVVVDDQDVAVGYALVDLVDGCAHVEQVSVHPDHHRRGLGRSLLERVDGWAAAAGCPALTLTSFRDVPWNAPYYERCGFRVLDDAELGPELRALRAREAAEGLDPDLRVCMRRDVSRTGTS